MKKIRVTVIHELEFDDDVKLVEGVEHNYINLDGKTISPVVEYWQLNDKGDGFVEPDEECLDKTFAALVYDQTKVEII